jgi:hypothetical protein
MRKKIKHQRRSKIKKLGIIVNISEYTIICTKIVKSVLKKQIYDFVFRPESNCIKWIQGEESG